MLLINIMLAKFDVHKVMYKKAPHSISVRGFSFFYAIKKVRAQLPNLQLPLH